MKPSTPDLRYGFRFFRSFVVTLGLALSACGTGNPEGSEEDVGARTQAVKVCNLAWPRTGITYTGDVSIVGQAQADDYKCIRVLQGNLTISSGESASISLPLLTRVTGNMRVGLVHRVVTPPDDRGSVEITTGALDLPQLATVLGNLALRNQLIGPFMGLAPTFDFGLDALTRVDGNLSITGTFFQSHFRVANTLEHLGGNLLIDWGVGDLDEANLLNSLTSVGGDARFLVGPNARIAASSLSEVGGSFAIQQAPGASQTNLGEDLASALHSVGGSLTLQNVRTPCDEYRFSQLTSIAGSLELFGGKPSAPLGARRGTLTTSGLAVSRTALTRLPLQSGFQVTSKAPVSATANPALCACQVDALAASLRDSGWLGKLSNTYNGASATCSPACPNTCQ